MASKETFLMVSLSEDKAKELAQVISNDTCRKILDALTEGDYSESDLSTKLSVPISTVHYNLQQLMKGGLVIVEEFHYSEKGKEINHYKLANKYIIIAPKKVTGLKGKLRKILPSLGVVLGVAAVMQIAKSFFSGAGASMSKVASMDMISNAAPDFAVKGGEILNEASPQLMDSAVGATSVVSNASGAVTQTVPTSIQYIVQSNMWQYAALWFLIGGIVAILVYLVIDMKHNK